MTDTNKYVATIQLKILYIITEDVIEVAQNMICNFHVFMTFLIYFILFYFLSLF